MAIDAIRVVQTPNYVIFYVDLFSDQFKQVIRDLLRGIWNGFAEADTLPEFYSYERTLTAFLERYNSKSEDIKKGMIGELLAHILIGHYDAKLTSLSILKNKEERSIKKGFDIIYWHQDHKSLWYSEVKSGRSESGSDNSSQYNRILLTRAKAGIISMISERRNSLWESALIDVSLVIRENSGRLNLKQLLSQDAPTINLDQKKNVILISALYHELQDCIPETCVSDFYNENVTEDEFNQLIVVSIQKATFEKVAQFLHDEINHP